jgi:hypothetical protein
MYKEYNLDLDYPMAKVECILELDLYFKEEMISIYIYSIPMI